MKPKQIIGTILRLTVTTGYGAYRLFKDTEPSKYSNGWFKTESDEIFEKEREIVRQQFVNYRGDFSLAVTLEKLLYRFDSIMSDRAWGNKSEGFPKHTVHDWYLPSGDS